MKPWFWNGEEKPKQEYLEYTYRFPGACKKHEFVGFVCFLILSLLLLIGGISVLLYSVKPLLETLLVAVPLIGVGLTFTIGICMILKT